MAKFLNQTGRHVMYSCEWPLYERSIGVKVSTFGRAPMVCMTRGWSFANIIDVCVLWIRNTFCLSINCNVGLSVNAYALLFTI